MFQRTSLYWQLSELSPVSIAHLRGEHLLGPVRRGEQSRHLPRGVRVVEAVGPLHAGRRLVVDHVHVAELREGEQPLAVLAPGCGRADAEVGTDHASIGRAGHDLAVALRARRSGTVRAVRRRTAGGEGLLGERAEDHLPADGGDSAQDQGRADERTP
jgi:hypothetical protein